VTQFYMGCGVPVTKTQPGRRRLTAHVAAWAAARPSSLRFVGDGMTLERFTSRISARLGPGALSEMSGATATADVAARRWIEALRFARDELGCDCLDWLSAVDELTDGFAIVAHVYPSAPPGAPHLLLRTRVPAGAPHLPTATSVYSGAAWHERRTADTFGVVFDGHPDPVPLLLPDGFGSRPPGKPG
jgi:NADH-quinone oxidoreductase subunit C